MTCTYNNCCGNVAAADSQMRHGGGPRLPAPQSNEGEPLVEALKAFELHPEFARAQVWMREQLETGEQSVSPDAAMLGTRSRLQYVLQRLDIRAEAFLQLVGDATMQRAYVFVMQSLAGFAYQEYTGTPLEVLRPASAASEADLATIEERGRCWIGRGYQLLASQHSITAENQPAPLHAISDRGAEAGTRAPVSSSARPGRRYPKSSLSPAKWEQIELSLTSEYQVQIRVGEELEAYKFADLGLADRRSGNPNLAWHALLYLAEGNGIIKTAMPGAEWRHAEKRIQTLRSFLVQHFNLPGDPLVFQNGLGYRARFQIRQTRGYHA